MISARSLAVVCLLLSLAVILPALAGEKGGWTQFRGPAAEGATLAARLPDGSFGLQVAWTRELGSGYSNISIADGKAVTMFTAGEVDVLAAFDPENGEQLWRYELGEKYVGHTGSDDGPIGTPTLHDGTVYALGPRGQLVALNLADGRERWRHDLDEATSSVPFYGYTTSPLVSGKLLIVATGGEGHAVSAFDRATGKPKWTSGDDTVAYQTPMLVELGGRRQLLTVTDRFLQGLDPDSGETLWELQHTEGERGEESAHPTMVDGEHFLVKYGRGSRLYRYAGGGVKEVWESRAFGNSYALPVFFDDHFYGFSGNVLTCVDAKTGEIAWRSRALGSQGLSAVGSLLAVVSSDGELVLFDPSPDGYREVTRIPVFEEGDYAIPSFSDGRFLIRNLAQMAAVSVDTAVAPQVAKLDESNRFLGDFGKWLASIEALPENRRQAAVDVKLDAIAMSPIVDDGGLAHLVWRGEADDVGVAGDITGGGPEMGLYRLEGTDLFFRSMELDPKAQYAYNFIVDFGDPQTDPGNPYTIDNGFAVSSELRMPEWPASPHLETPAEGTARGTLDGFPFRSEILDNTREIKVWRPAGYGSDPDARYPVLVVNHGDNLLRGGLMQNSLDNLVGSSVAPLIAVFVPRTNPPEYGGPSADDYTRFLVEELLPHVDRHYLTDPEHRAIMGPGSAGVAAVFAAFSRPDVFQKAAAQSFYPIEPVQDRLPTMIAEAGAKPELIYLVWSRRDYDLGGGRRADDASRELIGQLRAANVEVIEQVSDYSPGWGGWRGQDDEILAALFPPAPEE
jgi:outer membrane protein assembly factor BamB/enterochelin esterase-like enzyme